MLTLAFSMVAYIRAIFLPSHQLALEAAALRQQLVVLSGSRPTPGCIASIAASGLRSAGCIRVGLKP